jgi:hypothetical protein
LFLLIIFGENISFSRQKIKKNSVLPVRLIAEPAEHVSLLQRRMPGEAFGVLTG